MRGLNLFVCLLLAGLWCAQLNAQLIDNAEGISLLDGHGFNPAFVRANKIASISGELSSKRESDIIRESGETTTYEFDRAGRLVKVEMARKRKGQREFNATYFRYGKDGLLLDKIQADISGATSYSYEYDAGGRVVRETCSRMESPADTLNPAGPKRTEIYTETISYKELDGAYKKITSNSYGKPYKEETFYFDEHEYLTAHQVRFITNQKMSRTAYSYNERGLLSEKLVVPDLSKSDTLRYEYGYDQAGNLLEAFEFKNSEKVRRMEFMYDESSWMLKARLSKEEETQFIRIVQYETLFFD